jgi:hypothetical protein
MPKIELTPKQVLEYIIVGIRNTNYQASIDIAQDCIDELEIREKAEAMEPSGNGLNKTEKKLAEYLEWALSMIDENFKDTGKIGVAEVVVYKAAQRFLKDIKPN